MRFGILAALALLAGAALSPARAASAGIVHGPVLPQPRAAGDLVGLIVQNIAPHALPPGAVSLGQIFRPGAVPRGRRLGARSGGRTLPVQMDVKTRYPDGSVTMAVLTLAVPALAPHGAAPVMLELAPAGAPAAPAIDLAHALPKGALAVVLAFHHPDGTVSRARIDPIAALARALRSGHASFWRRGALASEARVTVPVAGSFRLVFDITAEAGGGFSADIQFNNDLAMGRHGGTMVYDATILERGKPVLTETNITQYQYQDWHVTVSTNPGVAAINIQHDIAYLESTGAIPEYDLANGIAASLLAAEAHQMAQPGWARPLATNGVTRYMPMTGGRDDIGPTTEANVVWLMTQNALAASFALGQAEAAGAVPWHFFFARTGQFLTTNDIPNLWIDPRGGNSGTTGLTQKVSSRTGWTTDGAHQPNLSYVAYLLTGSRYYLDQLNAQGVWSIAAQWPAAIARNNGEGNVVRGNQVRGAAWDLRQIIESAYVDPDGSPMKTYFTEMEDNNFNYMLRRLPVWTGREGEAHGYIPGAYGGNGAMAPWEQDYFASTVVAAAQLGNPAAVTVLKWQANFLVGRFLPHPGWNRRDGAAYNLFYYSTSSGSTGQGPLRGTLYRSWAAIEQATLNNGQSNGGGWAHSQGDYAQLALQSLAGIITILHSSEAERAWRWLRASGAPFLGQAVALHDPLFNILPARAR